MLCPSVSIWELGRVDDLSPALPLSLLYVKPMKKILVIQIARLGDLLQSTLFLHALREHEPGAFITAVVNDRLRPVLASNPCVDEVIGLDLEALTRQVGARRTSLASRYIQVRNRIGDLLGARFSDVYNLNYAPAALYLASMVPAARRGGYWLHERPGRDGLDGAVVRDPWLDCLFASVSCRRMSRMNLVDIYGGSAPAPPRRRSLSFPVGPEDQARAEDLLDRLGMKGRSPLIGLQVGARSAVRCWPPASFARLADRLIRSLGASIMLLGAGDEKGLAEAVLRSVREKSMVANAVGTTGLRGLAALLGRCRLLVTTDTGAMHVAAAVGTPVAALFFASADCHTTGPYGSGHFVIQTDLPCHPCDEEAVSCPGVLCRELITPDSVCEAAKLLLEGEESSTASGRACFSGGLTLYRSSLDAQGVRYDPIAGDTLPPEHDVAGLYREAWGSILNPGLQSVGEAEPASTRNDAALALRFGRLRLLFEQGLEATGLPAGRSEEAVRYEADRIETRCTEEAESAPLLVPMVQYLKFAGQSARGRANGSWPGAMHAIYEGLARGARLMEEGLGDGEPVRADT